MLGGQSQTPVKLGAVKKCNKKMAPAKKGLQSRPKMRGGYDKKMGGMQGDKGDKQWSQHTSYLTIVKCFVGIGGF